MRLFSIALSCALSTGVQAQTPDWQGILQRGINDVIRSIETPQRAPDPVYTPAPASKPAQPPATRSAQADQVTPSKQAAQALAPPATREAVNTRIVDNLGVKPAEFERFFNRLKAETAAGNRKALARMMKYPLGVKGSTIKVFSSQDFLAHYDSIFTPSVVAVVRDQTYETLFVRDSGASFGAGLLWVSGACMDSSCELRVPRVSAVNPPDEEMVPRSVETQTGTVKGTLVGATLPEGASGPFGPCRELPAISGAVTVTGSVPHDDMHCYRLAGANGQSVHIELKSLNTGFNIMELAENRYDLTFKAKNQPYDIMLTQTLPGPGDDNYELRITVK